ncbi:MAG: PorT family protein [Muribaculaceae bacterium]|nr:PorT family protein [Muribaculaceae bacterium]
MNILRYILIAVIAVISLTTSEKASCQQLNDKLLNRPYADMRRWHLGFSVGVHTQDVNFTHNGFVTENGETWFMEQPAFSPGFCVNGLISFRLNDYFSVRFSPGMYFGNRDVRMIDTTTGKDERQNIKSALVVAPIDLKFASQRFRNVRPYITGGIMPAFDVAKKRSDFLKFNTSDFFLTVGFGCDFYLPYFKLIPELKFCFGLSDVLQHERPDLADDPDKMKYTQSLSKATSQMVVLTFYFE